MRFDPRTPTAGMRLSQRVLLVVLAAAGALVWLLLAGPRGATFSLTPTALVVETTTAGWTSTDTFDRAGLTAARGTLEGATRLAGTAMPGWCTGWFSTKPFGRSWLATNCGHEVVVVDGLDRRLVITPADADGFVTTLASGGTGTYGLAPGPKAGGFWALVALVTVGSLGLTIALLWLAPRRLSYGIEDGALVVNKLSGAWRLPLQGISARKAEPRFGLRLFGVGMPGYLTGWFRLDGHTTRVYATGSGPGVLLEGAGRRVFVTPADPDAMVQALQSAGAT